MSVAAPSVASTATTNTSPHTSRYNGFLGELYAQQQLGRHVTHPMLVSIWDSTYNVADVNGGSETTTATNGSGGTSTISLSNIVAALTSPVGTPTAVFTVDTHADGNTINGLSIPGPTNTITWTSPYLDYVSGGAFHVVYCFFYSLFDQVGQQLGGCGSLASTGHNPSNSITVTMPVSGTQLGFGTMVWMGLPIGDNVKMNEIPMMNNVVKQVVSIPAVGQPFSKMNVIPDLSKIPGATANDHGNPSFGIGTIGGGVEIL